MNIMKLSVCQLPRQLPLCGVLLASLLFAGCSHLYYADPNPSSPYVFPGQSQAPAVAQSTAIPQAGPPLASLNPVIPATTATAPAAPSAVAPGNTVFDKLRVGDAIAVAFSDIPPPGLLPVTQRIGNDGQIFLPHNVTLLAVGKTVAQLQEEIHNAYVPRIFVHMTPSVTTEGRFFFVEGEIKQPSRLPYNGEMTVLRAIASSGSFTDFANRKRIELRRATGEKFVINWFKANENATLDLAVVPNDLIIVRRKGVWGL